MYSQPVHVLVTGAGSAPALAFVRGLRAQSELDVRLIGVDGVPDSFGLFECDYRYTVPPVKDVAFLDAIRAICRAHHVEVIVPTLDFELDLFAGAASVLWAELGVRVISNTPATVALARDKRRSAAVAASAGVAVPRTYAQEEIATAPLPLVIKPTIGAGSIGVTVVRTTADLERAVAAAGPQPLAQELVVGPEYTVDLVVAPDGAILAAAPRHRVEVRGGQSYKGRTVDDEEVEDSARRCALAHRMTGQGNVQLIKAHGGRTTFIELNPKFAAALGLTVAAGLNIPLLYVKLALGLPIAPNELTRRSDVWMLRAWQERFIDASDVDAVPPWTDARC